MKRAGGTERERGSQVPHRQKSGHRLVRMEGEKTGEGKGAEQPCLKGGGGSQCLHFKINSVEIISEDIVFPGHHASCEAPMTSSGKR